MAKAIGDDVAFTILSKLPLKSLKRFTCVHKSWFHLLENPYFMTMFRNDFISKHHSYYDDTSLLIWTNCKHNSRKALYFLSGDKFENRVKLDLPPPLQQHERFIDISTSAIHGTFCFYSAILEKFVLWNPEEFKVIPPSRLESRHRPCALISPWGFGYDSVRDDFKVIRMLENVSYYSHARRVQIGWPVIPDPCWEIYSLRSNSWKKLDMPTNYAIDDMGPEVNGVCNWLANTYEYGGATHFLLSFDLNNEVFFTTPLPLDTGYEKVQKNLVAINGFIAVILKYAAETPFHILILDELGVRESWTKLFIVDEPLFGITRPIGMGKMGIFFKKSNGQLALFNFSTLMLEEITFESQLDGYHIIIYKKNIRHY